MIQNLKRFKVLFAVNTGMLSASIQELDTVVRRVLTKPFVDYTPVYTFQGPEIDKILDKDTYNVICTTDNADVEYLLRDFKQVNWVHDLYTGCERILKSDLLRNNQSIILTNCRDVSKIPLSEFAAGSALYFLRNFPFFENQKRLRQWHSRIPLPFLNEKKVAVFGYGSVGLEVGRVFKQGFNAHVTAVKRESSSIPLYADAVANLSDIKQVVSQHDIIINCLPNTPQTAKIFSNKLFQNFKKNSVFINVGRGTTVDEDGLADVLRSGRILGAALDVTAQEPLPTESQWFNEEFRDKVLLTFHSSDEYPELLEGRGKILEENLYRYAKGEQLINIVNKHAGY